MRAATALCAATCLLLGAPALAGAASEPPQARASAKCGTVETRNGGRARHVTAIRARCRIARRVARRATGRRYRAFGFSCKAERKRRVAGKVYGCGRVRNGRGQGIGFVYRAP